MKIPLNEQNFKTYKDDNRKLNLESDGWTIAFNIDGEYADALESIPEMINALIRQYLSMKGENLSKDAYERFLRIENALMRAGVEL